MRSSRDRKEVDASHGVIDVVGPILPRRALQQHAEEPICDAREVLALRVGWQPVRAADAGELWVRVRVRVRVRVSNPNPNPKPDPNLGRSSRAASRG